VTAAALACSLSIELGQFYAFRNSAMADVYANTAGGFLGALAAALGSGRKPILGTLFTRDYFVALLLSAWLGYRLFPYVPTIDLYQYKAALKPLFLSPQLSLTALYRHFAMGLVVSSLIAEIAGVGRSRVLAPLCLLAVAGVRVTISGVVLSPAEVLGSAAAAFCWAVVIAPLRWRAPIVAAALAVLIVAAALEPFQFLPDPRPFGWIPFRGLMGGSTTVNILAMFEKTVMYGSMVWLLEKCGPPLPVAAAVTSLAVLVLRLLQTYVPGRSAEITDSLLVLLLAGLMALLRAGATRPAPSRPLLS
jgi:hypothetical protein